MIVLERIALNIWQSIPDIRVTDIIEVVILGVLIYNIMLWIKNTRAWVLLKGVLIFLGFFLLAYVFKMGTILFLAEKLVNIGIIALVIIFQPELRHALEQLGRNKVLGFIFSDSSKEEENSFTEKTVNEIVKASFEMSKVKTGALIVIEKTIPLTEYERTGISVDGIVTSQLLLNIFEKNTPLHDGAVVIKGNRITAATCYLPLSENMFISKALGTRHRAALGVSEVTDSMTIVVSEETGAVSIAHDGKLDRRLDPDMLKEQLLTLIGNTETKKKRIGLQLLKGRSKDEKDAE